MRTNEYTHWQTWRVLDWSFRVLVAEDGEYLLLSELSRLVSRNLVRRLDRELGGDLAHLEDDGLRAKAGLTRGRPPALVRRTAAEQAISRTCTPSCIAVHGRLRERGWDTPMGFEMSLILAIPYAVYERNAPIPFQALRRESLDGVEYWDARQLARRMCLPWEQMRQECLKAKEDGLDIEIAFEPRTNGLWETILLSRDTVVHVAERMGKDPYPPVDLYDTAEFVEADPAPLQPAPAPVVEPAASPAASPLDQVRHLDGDGNEYWSARELMGLMGYGSWQYFRPVIERAETSARNQGLYGTLANFMVAHEVSGARGPAQEDRRLSRFAAYLVAMNGDPRKSEVAAAQAYFAPAGPVASLLGPASQAAEPAASAAASPLDQVRHLDGDGSEHWSARELMSLMGYGSWQYFRPVLERAEESARNQGLHGTSARFMVNHETPEGGGPERTDYHLSRLATYLVAMNGDPRKKEVASAQAYFAYMTRAAETGQVAAQATDELPEVARARQVIDLVRQQADMLTPEQVTSLIEQAVLSALPVPERKGVEA